MFGQGEQQASSWFLFPASHGPEGLPQWDLHNMKAMQFLILWALDNSHETSLDGIHFILQKTWHPTWRISGGGWVTLPVPTMAVAELQSRLLWRRVGATFAAGFGIRTAQQADDEDLPSAHNPQATSGGGQARPLLSTSHTASCKQRDGQGARPCSGPCGPTALAGGRSHLLSTSLPSYFKRR